MKFKLFTLSFIMMIGFSFAQKVKYSKDQIDKMETYFFNEGFAKPDRVKTSTIVGKDGVTTVGYCTDVERKKGQIYSITVNDSITGKEKKFDAENVQEMFVYARAFEKAMKVSKYMGNMRNWGTKSLNKNVTNDHIYFINQSVSLKNKRDEKQFLMQLINPEFSNFISVYHDPNAGETASFGMMGAPSFGGGVIKSYYVKKGDKVIWLKSSEFEDNYDFLFGDNPNFVKKYPKKSMEWDYFSYLVLEYTKMKLENQETT